MELATPKLALDKKRQIERTNVTTFISLQETPACKANIALKAMNINLKKAKPIKTFFKALVYKTRVTLIKIGMLTTSLYSDGEKGKEKNLVSNSGELPAIW